MHDPDLQMIGMYLQNLVTKGVPWVCEIKNDKCYRFKALEQPAGEGGKQNSMRWDGDPRKMLNNNMRGEDRCVKDIPNELDGLCALEVAQDTFQ